VSWHLSHAATHCFFWSLLLALLETTASLPRLRDLVVFVSSSFIHSFIRSLIHSLIHSFIHSLTCSRRFGAFQSRNKGRADGIMCAMSQLNGESSCGNKLLLQTMLRDQWRSDAIVQTDCCDSVQTMVRPSKYLFLSMFLSSSPPYQPGPRTEPAYRQTDRQLH
jgi:hypothetical protein